MSDDDLAGEFPHASNGEIARVYKEHVLRVELVQAEQLAALRSLAKHGGVMKVWVGISACAGAELRGVHWRISLPNSATDSVRFAAWNLLVRACKPEIGQLGWGVM